MSCYNYGHSLEEHHLKGIAGQGFDASSGRVSVVIVANSTALYRLILNHQFMNSTIKSQLKIGLIILVIAAIAGLIMSACNQQKQEASVLPSTPELSELEKREQDSLRKIRDERLNARLKEIQDSTNRAREKKKLELERKFNILKTKFVSSKDEITGIEFYTHKTFGKYWPNRKTLKAICSSEGYMYLQSVYHDDDWLFHTHVVVKFSDNTIMETQPVPSFDKNNKTDNDSGNIWEVISYEDGSPIISKIAANPAEKVYVRYIGRQHYDDTYLSKADKNALRDTWQLVEYMSLIKLVEQGVL